MCHILLFLLRAREAKCATFLTVFKAPPGSLLPLDTDNNVQWRVRSVYYMSDGCTNRCGTGMVPDMVPTNSVDNVAQTAS